MGKALMVWGPAASLASGRGIILAGGSQSSTNETLTSLEATEAATFSGLAYRSTSGGSGTNDLAFWENVSAGNQIATRAGAGLAADTTNTDVLAAGDLFTGAATDNGTDPANLPFASCNVEFSSGHGNFHACSNALQSNHDVASATRYIPFAGEMIQDGGATIANQQFLNRAYTSCEAIQVRVAANLRTTDSTLSLNVNGSNVGDPITIGAGLTGLFVVDEMGEALASGDLVCAALTTGAGTQDMNLMAVCGTFKSTAGKSEAIAHNESGLARTASATPNYIAPGGNLSFALASTEANSRVKVGFAATLANLRAFVIANTCTGDQTVKVFKNGSAVLTLTIAASATGSRENTADTADIDADDEVSFEFLGGTSGSATFSYVMFTFEPLAEGGGIEAEAAITEAGDTLASTATLVIAGTASITEAGDTLSATATLPIVSSASITEADETLASTAAVVISGAASILEDDDALVSTLDTSISLSAEADLLEDDDSVSSTSTVLISSETSISEDDDSVSSAIAVLISAEASISEDDDTISSEAVIVGAGFGSGLWFLGIAGEAGGVISAEVSISEDDDTLASTVTLQIAGSASITEGDDSLVSTAVSGISATASISEDDDTLESTILVSAAGSIIATASISEDDDTLESTATLGVRPALPQPQPRGKRKLPKRRRATILRHIEKLKNPVNLNRELELARLNLEELEAIERLLNAQDQLLIGMYRKLYLEYVLKQDDETIMFAW